MIMKLSLVALGYYYVLPQGREATHLIREFNPFLMNIHVSFFKKSVPLLFFDPHDRPLLSPPSQTKAGASRRSLTNDQTSLCGERQWGILWLHCGNREHSRVG